MTVDVEQSSATSARLSWLPPNRTNWNGRIEYYLLTATPLEPQASRKRRVTSPLTVTNSSVPQANHPDPSLASEPLQREMGLMEGLEEGFEYRFDISVINAAGIGVSSAPKFLTMNESG